MIRWSQISQHLPGRTDNEIKNYWHTHLKKKVDRSKQVQGHLKHDYTDPNMTSKEPSSSCLNTNNSSADMIPSCPSISPISNLPKLLFADWVSLDELQQEIDMSSDELLISLGSNYQLSTTEHESLHNYEGPTEVSENRNCLDMGSHENVLHTQMPIDQIFEFDGDFDMDNLIYM